MQMKATFAPKGMFPTVGSFRMRMYTLHQDELHDSIYLGWLTAKIITRYNFGNQIGLLKLTVEFAYRKHHLSTCTRSAHDATVFENWYSLNYCISRRSFTTTDSITADTVIEFLDELSFQVRKNTFVVLDNATVHRNHKVEALRPIWEKRGLFLFYLPPYSPHLNIAETLWRILKGKWIRVQDYASTDTLFYAANRILAAVGEDLFIKYSYTVA